MDKSPRQEIEEMQIGLQKMRSDLHSTWNNLLIDHVGLEMRAQALPDEQRAYILESMKFNEAKNKAAADALFGMMDLVSNTLASMIKEV